MSLQVHPYVSRQRQLLGVPFTEQLAAGVGVPCRRGFTLKNTNVLRSTSYASYINIVPKSSQPGAHHMTRLTVPMPDESCSENLSQLAVHPTHA